MREGVILYVDDDENDAFFMSEALRQGGVGNLLEVVNSGEDAVTRLSDPALRVALLIADVNLVGMSGFEVLAWVRGQARLRELPVLLLSSSAFEKDQARAKDLGADGYIVKPNSVLELARVLRPVVARWLA